MILHELPFNNLTERHKYHVLSEEVNIIYRVKLFLFLLVRKMSYMYY